MFTVTRAWFGLGRQGSPAGTRKRLSPRCNGGDEYNRTLIEVRTVKKSMLELGRMTDRIVSPQMFTVSLAVRLPVTDSSLVGRERVTTCDFVRVVVDSSVTVFVLVPNGCVTVKVRVSVGGGVTVNVLEGGVRVRVPGGVLDTVTVTASVRLRVSIMEIEGLANSVALWVGLWW